MNAQNDEPRFDPRHDPIFQRGYQPDAGTVPEARHPQSPQSDPAHTPGLNGVQRGTDAVRVHAAAPLSAAGPVPAAEPSEGAGPGGDSATQGDGAPIGEDPRNPYFLALWIMAVTFVVAGVALEWRSVALADYGYSSQGQVSIEAIIQQLTWVIAPILITVGLGTIVALLFWQAIHWTSPRSRREWPRASTRDRAGQKAAPWRLGRWS